MVDRAPKFAIGDLVRHARVKTRGTVVATVPPPWLRVSNYYSPLRGDALVWFRVRWDDPTAFRGAYNIDVIKRSGGEMSVNVRDLRDLSAVEQLGEVAT